jgi:LPPG:FO 2-phospho-L-lactate transferase
LTVIVNVGDDDYMYGVHVAADLDTVTYTLAGVQGSGGWGIAADTFTVMDELARRGIDSTFRLGDRDLATCLLRTARMRQGFTLSQVTAEIAASLEVTARVVPASDDPVATRVRIPSGEWLSFQDYFVQRGHRDEVADITFDGAATATAAPGVVNAIANAHLVVLAPSNPPLSIWPILAVPGIRDAVRAADRVVAISPLIGGEALKGPAADVLRSLGLGVGTAGVLAAYDGLLTSLVIDTVDRRDTALATPEVAVVAADTHIAEPAAGRDFAAWLLETMLP